MTWAGWAAVSCYQAARYGATIAAGIEMVGDLNSPTSVAHENVTSSSVFSTLGVRVSFFSEFIAQHEAELSHRTTGQVCEEIVKPMTKRLQCSFCDFIAEGHQDAVGTAEVFISHAWRSSFVEVAKALQHHFHDQPDTIVWFDLFSINQHGVDEDSSPWLLEALRPAIAEIGHTVVVLPAWHDPMPFRRAWCLYELHCGFAANCKFAVAMLPGEQDKCLEAIRRDQQAMDSMLAIDISSSECKGGKSAILSVVEQLPCGVDCLNATVAEGVRKWAQGLLTSCRS